MNKKFLLFALVSLTIFSGSIFSQANTPEDRTALYALVVQNQEDFGLILYEALVPVRQFRSYEFRANLTNVSYEGDRLPNISYTEFKYAISWEHLSYCKDNSIWSKGENLDYKINYLEDELKLNSNLGYRNQAPYHKDYVASISRTNNKRVLNSNILDVQKENAALLNNGFTVNFDGFDVKIDHTMKISTEKNVAGYAVQEEREIDFKFIGGKEDSSGYYYYYAFPIVLASSKSDFDEAISQVVNFFDENKAQYLLFAKEKNPFAVTQHNLRQRGRLTQYIYHIDNFKYMLNLQQYSRFAGDEDRFQRSVWYR